MIAFWLIVIKWSWRLIYEKKQIYLWFVFLNMQGGGEAKAEKSLSVSRYKGVKNCRYLNIESSLYLLFFLYFLSILDLNQEFLRLTNIFSIRKIVRFDENHYRNSNLIHHTKSKNSYRVMIANWFNFNLIPFRLDRQPAKIVLIQILEERQVWRPIILKKSFYWSFS